MKLQKLYTTFLCFATIGMSFSSKSQSLTKLEEKIIELRKSGVNTFLTYTPLQNTKSNIDKGKYLIVHSEYLIWYSDNVLYTQKFSDCLDNKSERFYDTAFRIATSAHQELYRFFIDNFADLQYVKLKPGIVRGKIDGIDTLLTSFSHHSDYTGIKIFTPSGETLNGFTLDNLNDGLVRNIDGSTRAVRESINYEYNISTPIYRFTKLLSDLIESFEERNYFDQS